MSQGHAALDARLADTVFARVGGSALLETPEGDTLLVRAIVDEETILRGELGDVIDPRPSVTLDRRVVGDRPRGRLTVGPRLWVLDRPIDGGDRYEVRVYLTPAVDE